MLHGAIGFGNENVLNYPKFLFCGSFNPMHDGHVAIIDYIYNKYKVPVDLEISLSNVEKSPINIDEVWKRYKQIQSIHKPSFGRLYITDNARYLEKAKILPDVTFVCGFDTMKALCDGKHYKQEKFENVIREFSKLGITWLVFPRHKNDGTVSKLEDFKNINKALLSSVKFADDFEAVKMSSRELRK